MGHFESDKERSSSPLAIASDLLLDCVGVCWSKLKDRPAEVVPERLKLFLHSDHKACDSSQIRM